jgi:hypothetical protein
LSQSPYVVLNLAPIHSVPVEGGVLRSVHRHAHRPSGVQLVHRFRSLRSSHHPQAHLTHVSALSGPGNHPCPASYAAPPAKELVRGAGFPVAFRRTGIRFLGHRSPAEELGLPHGRLTGPRAGPQRGCHVAHAQDTTGQDASFIPGTVVRTRSANTLRPAPAAFQRPAPTAPLELPISGGHLHETSTEVHAIRPSPRQPHRHQGRGASPRRSSPCL